MGELPPPTIEAEEAARAARSVLSERKYIEAARPPSLRERFFDWLFETIGDLLGALSSGGGRGVIAWAIVAVFLGLVVFLLSRLLGRIDPIRRPAAPADPDVDVYADRTAAEWLRTAVELEATGDWREALRCRHRALVVELLDRGLVTGRPGNTAHEIARQAGDRLPAVAADLEAATVLFEEVWYGWTSPSEVSRDAFVARVDRVLQVADDAEAELMST